MYKIKFSHDYRKLHGQHQARLMAAFKLDIGKEDLTSSALLAYDTLATEGTRYKLNPGEHVLLLFLGDKGIPFTTIRPRYNRQRMDKLAYYSGLINQEFEIVINKENEK